MKVIEKRNLPPRKSGRRALLLLAAAALLALGGGGYWYATRPAPQVAVVRSGTGQADGRGDQPVVENDQLRARRPSDQTRARELWQTRDEASPR